MDAGVRNTQIPTYLVGPHIPQGRARAAAPEELPPSFFVQRGARDVPSWCSRSGNYQRSN